MISPADLDKLLDRLIAREGGYVADASDPGGATKYGISQRSYPDVDIKSLTLADAKRIYQRDFVNRYNLGALADVSVCESVLDWIVHSGHGAAIEIQRIAGVKPDGVYGEKTIAALNTLDSPKPILTARLFFLARITKHRYIVGWLRRLNELGLFS